MMADKQTDMPEISPGLARFIIALNEAGGIPLLNAVANLVDQVGPEQARVHLERYSALQDFEEAAQRDPEVVAKEAISNPNQIRFGEVAGDGDRPAENEGSENTDA